ncbi:MAG: AbrB/MazE/SpoVT family DNA-binding domain-containing protein [Chloroflexi bacterium]|nr:AbrB/MazE/SpoVT family DNA-binding domain-containing protein [Chloroflexota bacterium]
MQTKVQKWGNSLALRIPKSFAVEVGLENDTAVDLTLIEGKLVVTPLVQPPFTLDGLLAGITAENLHTEIDSGAAVGKEVW